MAYDSPDPFDPRTDYAVAKERIKHLEEMITQLQDSVMQANRSIEYKDTFIERLREDRDDWHIKWERMQRDYVHTQNLIKRTDQKIIKNKKNKKTLATQASLLFLLSSILVNIGTSMLTGIPVNSLGWVMLILAGITYYIAFRITYALAQEEENS